MREVSIVLFKDKMYDFSVRFLEILGFSDSGYNFFFFMFYYSNIVD